MVSRLRILTLALLATLCVAAAAAGQRPAAGHCDRSKLAGRGYIECLENALRESDSALAKANRRTQAVIDARADLAPTQRTRWKN